MKFVIDKDIPFIKGVFEPWAEVVYLEGSAISRVDLLDADALIIRTRTRCDATLLAGTGVKIIATATIGFDHIDLDYCASRAGTRPAHSQMMRIRASGSLRRRRSRR